MRRFQLFEFEDFEWFPKIIRDGGTDFLGFVLNHLKYYEPAIKIIEDVVLKTKYHQIVDLCSGNGYPIALVNNKLDPDLKVTYFLTDKFPNLAAFEHLKSTSEGIIDYSHEPLDIIHDTISIKGIRTMFTAIHHFNAEDVKRILTNAVNDQEPIAIFDGGNKNLGSILAILIAHPILFLIFTPFIKPFKWNRLLFTYLIPLIPLYAIWDGIVSILRLHTPDELLHYAQTADVNKGFTWSSGKVRNSIGFSIAYLVGIPN